MLRYRPLFKGDELPPGSNVWTSLTTGDDGTFQIEDVPPGKPFRFGFRIAGTRREIETESFTLEEPGVHDCEVSLDSTRSQDGSVTLRLRYRAVDQP